MRRRLTSALVISCVAAPVAGQIPLRSIGNLPGTFDSSYANGVSADGRVVIGCCARPNPNPGLMPVIWTPSGGLEPLGSLGGEFGDAAAISADGSVVAGWSVPLPGPTSTRRLFRWTRAGGMQDLGLPPDADSAVPEAISADGNSICGQGYRGQIVSFRWTLAGGFNSLGPSAFAVDISDDGQTVLCRGGDTGYLWTLAGGLQPLPPSPINWLPHADVEWLSGDASSVIGTLLVRGLDWSVAYQWSAATGYQTLPAGSLQLHHWFVAASPDGSLLVTFGAFQGIGPFVLTGGQAHDAWDYLRARGADLSGWTDLWITGVSADLRTFVGYGLAPSGQREGWVVALPFLCYANCDNSTTSPAINVNDFACFLNAFAAGEPYANCDGSTLPPVLTVADFGCFLNRFAAGCS